MNRATSACAAPAFFISGVNFYIFLTVHSWTNLGSALLTIAAGTGALWLSASGWYVQGYLDGAKGKALK